MPGGRFMRGSIVPAAAAAIMIANLASVTTPAPAAAAQPFDGSWQVVIDCTPTPDGARGYRWRFDAQVRDGSLLGQFHEPGTNASGTLSGIIRPNGDALLRMNGNTGSPQYSVGQVAVGTPFHYTVTAHFAATSGSGQRNELRQCDLTFTRN
jgi:hypothetical protein